MAPPRQLAGHPWSSWAYEPKRRLGDTEVGFTQTLPYLQGKSFLPQHANRFSEAGLLTCQILPWWRLASTLPWWVIFVFNDPSCTSYVDRRIILE